MKKNLVIGCLRISFLIMTAIITPMLWACNKEEDPEPELNEMPEDKEDPTTAVLDSAEYKASQLTLKDISNHANATDLWMGFKGAIKSDSISEYRVMLIKADKSLTWSLEDAKSLAADRYISLENTTTNFELQPEATQVDSDGDLIVENVIYRMAVLSVGVYKDSPVEILSDLSGVIVIDFDPLVTTLVPNLNGNDAVTLDGDGNIYVSNFGTYTSTGGTGGHVLRITPEGTSTIFVDGLKGPLGSTFDSQGNFYVINANNGSRGEVLKVTPAGVRSTIAIIDGWPAGLVTDAEDNLYVSNYSGSSIHKISPAGDLSVFATDGNLTGCVGIVRDSQGNLIAGNYNNGKILSIDASGKVSQITQIAGQPNLFAIGYITILDDVVYATGIGTHKIFKVSLGGSYEVLAGNGVAASTDGPLLEASFKNPNGIGADPVHNKLFVVDWGSKQLREIALGE